MYAIVEDGGKQYMVREGDTVNLELHELAEGTKSLTLDKVLLVGEGKDARVGAPYVSGAKVTAKVVEAEMKGPKLYIEKYRRRKGYHMRRGHRQKYTRVMIEKISG